MYYLFKLVHPKLRPDINDRFTYKRITAFLYMFLTQQIIFAIYGIFLGIKLGIVGLILSLVVSLLAIKYIDSFESIQSSITTSKLIKHPVKIIRNRILLILGISMTYNAIAMSLLKQQAEGTSENQKVITTYFHAPTSLILIIIMTIFVAPHIEEFCFRYLIIGPNTNKISMRTKFIFAGFLFAFAHVMGQLPAVFNHKSALIAWLFYLGQYAIMGLIFSQCYAKYQNYRLNVLLHSSWNTVTIITALITTYIQSR